MQALKQALANNPLIYITRDIERALGIEISLPGYFIISNYTSFANSVANGRTNILLIKDKAQLDTWQLLLRKETKDFINKIHNARILVFKNTTQIESICLKNNWPIINPSAMLADKVEAKISQIEWLGKLKKYLPSYSIKQLKDVSWPGKKFILQFNRSHTGSGTILIETAEQLKEIQKKFPDRDSRIAEYISGPLFTNNNIVAKDSIVLGNISYQITGMAPFTDRPFATIGNDWHLPSKSLDQKQRKQYYEIAENIGKKLRQDGWNGLFGIDVVMDEKTKQLYLVEINARQPASATYESQLQSRRRNKDEQITVFEAHLATLLGIDLGSFQNISIDNGAQIVQRITEQIKSQITLAGLDCNIISYDNMKLGQDLIRFQTDNSFMQTHNQLNQAGEKISHTIKSSI